MIDIIEFRRLYEIELRKRLEVFCASYIKYFKKDPEAFPELMKFENWAESFETEDW